MDRKIKEAIKKSISGLGQPSSRIKLIYTNFTMLKDMYSHVTYFLFLTPLSAKRQPLMHTSHIQIG